MFDSLDQAAVQFSPAALQTLNLAQALMMFLVSLYLDGAALRNAWRFPKSIAVGLVSQWLLLPALTLLLIAALDLPAGAALGLLLVAACPGGNASSFLSLLARGNIALSVSLAAVSTLAVALMTPLVFTVSAQLAGLSHSGQNLHIDALALLRTAVVVLLLPLLAGLAFRHFFPRAALRIRGPLKLGLGALLLVFIVGATHSNADKLQGYLLAVAPLVFLHNSAALIGGYLLAWISGLQEADRRAIALSAGITNSGLSLLLVFGFFGGAGAMAVVAAWWGAWRLLSGGLLALLWSRWPRKLLAVEPPAA